MTTTTDLHDELRHVRDLVCLRELLRSHGATAMELDRHDATIRGAHARLARCAKADTTRLAEAA